MQEIAVFQDVDQFQPGRTFFACGYFAVRVVEAACENGKTPSLKPQQIAVAAEADYQHFDGSNGPSNRNGMSDQQLYDDLTERRIMFHALPKDMAWVRGFVRAGYAVIVGVAETSVFDKQLGRCPYDAWTPAGTHIFVVSGAGPQLNDVWCRDTANVDKAWKLRSGPRLYDVSRFQLTSATVVYLPWQHVPPPDFNPVAIATVHEFEPNDDDFQVSQIVRKDVALVAAYAIPQAWLRARWQHSYNFGPPLEPERGVTRNGTLYMEQQFSAARASWNSVTNKTIWYGATGPIFV